MAVFLNQPGAITLSSLTFFLYHFFLLFLTLFIQWLKLKVAFFDSQSQPLRAITYSATQTTNLVRFLCTFYHTWHTNSIGIHTIHSITPNASIFLGNTTINISKGIKNGQKYNSYIKIHKTSTWGSRWRWVLKIERFQRSKGAYRSICAASRSTTTTHSCIGGCM